MNFELWHCSLFWRLVVFTSKTIILYRHDDTQQKATIIPRELFVYFDLVLGRLWRGEGVLIES